MKHYGDITKINGAEVPIVDIICGGSPCQDLSVAGKRAGLDGERSGLFMEQIRIVKEQRDECIRQLRVRGADINVRSVKPRWLIWENVPGAFSSNKGEDFRCVLEEICRIADQTADVPLPAKGKWSTSGAIVGDGWSVAWRVHDAQFWGVPQRRKRISVVADFGGESAPEVLFEREGMPRNSEQSGEERKESAGAIGDGTPSASNVFGDEIMPTLVSRLETPVGNTQDGFNVVTCYGMDNERRRGVDEFVDQSPTVTSRAGTGGNNVPIVVEKEPVLLANNQNMAEVSQTGICNTLPAAMGMGGGYVPMVVEGSSWDGSQTSPTLTANNANGAQRMPDKENFNAVLQETYTLSHGGFMVDADSSGKAHTLQATDYKDAQVVAYGVDCYNQSMSEEQTKALTTSATDSDHIPCVAYGLDRASFNQGQNAKFDFSVEEELAPTLVNRGPGGVLAGQ